MRISDWSSDVCSSDLRFQTAADRCHRPDRCGREAGSCRSPGRPPSHRESSPDSAARRCAAAGGCVETPVRPKAGIPEYWEGDPCQPRSEEHTSELQSLMRNSYAVFCLKKKKNTKNTSKENHKT